MFAWFKLIVYLCGIKLNKKRKTTKKMTEKITFSTRIEPEMKLMEVGDRLYFPIERIKSVLTSCSTLGAAMKRKFKTQRYTTLGYVQVTRTI